MKKIFIIISIFISLIIVYPAFAQQSGLDVGLVSVANTGLGTNDIRITIANIIRILLGFVGVVILVVTLYGGFLWMTAGGNAEKVKQAKQWITNGIIGLVIILSAYSLTSFIINALSKATGLKESPSLTGGYRSRGGGGGIRGDAFMVRDIIPQGKLPIRNVVVKVVFSKPVREQTVKKGIIVAKAKDSKPLDGTYKVYGGVVEFFPNTKCPAPNEDRYCFDKNTEYFVQVNSGAEGVKSIGGADVVCGLAGSKCKGFFTTGELIDVSSPTVQITKPAASSLIAVDSNVPFAALVEDDSGVSVTEFYVDDKLIDVSSPGLNTILKSYTAQVLWDTTGLKVGTEPHLYVIASDIANNKTKSKVIIVGTEALHCSNGVQDFDEEKIDCGGNDCGKCDGAACTFDKECASGVCLNNRCASLPTIEEVDPSSGAVSSFVTIKGRGFGNGGKVFFLGKIDDPDDDVVATTPPQCGDKSWQDNQIIIVVPKGAVSGPLKVINNQKLYDDTINDRGIKTEFIVNNQLNPGICLVSPKKGEPEETLKIEGKGFGSEKGRVLFDSASSPSIKDWNDKKISDVVIPFISAGVVNLKVATVDKKVSNSVQFEVLPSQTLPIIDRIKPPSGPVGQYITILGKNFGNDIGSVRFIDDNGKETLADTSFPDQCSNRYWHDNYITVKVPNLELGEYKVKVARGQKLSNGVVFKVNKAPKTPGICSIDPNNGPTNLQVSLYGEGFGDKTSKVVFFNQQENGQIGEWSDSKITVSVPDLAQTGPVYMVNSEGVKSNEVNFSVGTCAKDSCIQGYECCSDGACRPQGECTVIAPACKYGWLFSTGDLKFKVDKSPKVEEDSSCSIYTQSPSPWKDSQEACVNSLISVRFNTNMRDGDLLDPNKIKVLECGGGISFDEKICSPVLGDLELINKDTDKEGFIFTPLQRLKLSTWYKVIVDKNVTSDEGLKMHDDYYWIFKTRNDSRFCTVGNVLVAPPLKVLTDDEKTQELKSIITANNCNILKNDKKWDWKVDKPENVKIQNTTAAKNTVEALTETPKDDPAIVTAKLQNSEQRGISKIFVDFIPPKIVEFWPNCGSACVNAQIGARFNVPMNKDTFNKNNVKIYKCADDACSSESEIGISSLIYSDISKSLIIVPDPQLLEPSTKYRVMIIGGKSGPLSINNVPLEDLNYKVGGSINNNAFSWLFKTKNDKNICGVEKVEIKPKYKDVYLIGKDINYQADAYGSPDDCSTSGQILNNISYDWHWQSSFPSIAIISNADNLPKDKLDGKIDPLQKATTKNEGKVKISAQENSQLKKGEGTLNIICGYQLASECPSPATIETYGIDNNTCCRLRPKIAKVWPRDGSENVCRNATIMIEFDQLMDQRTLLGNVRIEYNNGANACPEDKSVRGFWYKFVHFVKSIFTTETNAAPNIDQWCPVKEVISDISKMSIVNSEGRKTGEATNWRIKLPQLFEKNTQYRVIVKGDDNLLDNIKKGVSSIFGINMYTNDPQTGGDYVFNFKTGEEVCKINYVKINITRKIDGKLDTKSRPADLFACAGRDDCPDDVDDNIEGAQHRYTAVAYDKDGNPLIADYKWSVSGDGKVILSNQSGSSVLVTAIPEEGEDVINVNAESYGSSATRSVKSKVFLCENPWPSLRDYPFIEPETNISMLYCRDAGEKGFADDLPPLTFPPVIKSGGNKDIFKELFFFVK